jgi:hypothetical protein
VSRNNITGDLQQTKGILTEEGRDNYDSIFPPKKIERGRFKWDKETKKFVSAQEWAAKYATETKKKTPMFFMKGNFEAFESPTSGDIITTQRQLDNEMKATGIRPYEGREQEQKEVDKYLQEQDKELEASISDAVDETAYQIKHNYSRPEAPSRVDFSLGESDE